MIILLFITRRIQSKIIRRIIYVNKKQDKIYSFDRKYYQPSLKKKYILFHKISNLLMRCETEFRLKPNVNLDTELIGSKNDLPFVYIEKFL